LWPTVHTVAEELRRRADRGIWWVSGKEVAALAQTGMSAGQSNSCRADVQTETATRSAGRANAATTPGVYAPFVDESERDAAERIGALVSTKSA
jgi:hypothetical protein